MHGMGCAARSPDRLTHYRTLVTQQIQEDAQGVKRTVCLPPFVRLAPTPACRCRLVRLWCSTCFGPPTSRYVEGSWVLAGFVRWGHVLGRLQPTAFCTTARRRTVLPPRLPCELHECLVRGRSATPACLGTSRRTRSVTCLPYLPVACRAGRPLFRSRAVRDCTAVPASGAAATATHKGSGGGHSPSTPSWCGAREGPLRALPRGLLRRRLLYAVSGSVGAAWTAIALGAQSGAHDQKLRASHRVPMLSLRVEAGARELRGKC